MEFLASGAPLVYHFEDGWSPLHHAVGTNSDAHQQAGSSLHLDVIQPLLNAGVAVNALRYRNETRSPETPLDVAETYRNDRAADAIRRAGSRTGRGMPRRVISPALAAALAHAGVPDSAYDLWGTEQDGAYCLGAASVGWAVWFCDDGRRVDEHEFATDNEAFVHLLRTLTGRD